MLVAFTVLTIKLYHVPLSDLSILGASLPEGLFDVVAFGMLVFGLLVFGYSWVGDVQGYRKWYDSREIWSQFKTNMPIDRTFYGDGARLIVQLFKRKKEIEEGARIEELPQDVQESYHNFENNIDLFIGRLEAHQNSFRDISNLGKFYVFVIWGAFPFLVVVAALISLICLGTFPLPPALVSGGAQ